MRFSRVGLPSFRLDRWTPYVPTSAGRDERLDLLRGYCVFAMVVDHIGGRSLLYAFTGGNRFYTSAAEAFILISGLVVGLVYRRLIERDGLGPSLQRGVERAGTLYLLTVALSLFIIPVSEILNLHWSQGIDLSDPPAFVVSVLTLHRTYYLVDIPLLYSVLILVAPLALLLLSQGKTALVVGASWLLWAAYQFFPEQADLPWRVTGNYLFFFSAWQVFFFTGVALGWHHRTLTRLLARFPRRKALLVSAVAFALLMGLYHLTERLDELWPQDVGRAEAVRDFLLDNLFAKADVRPGRLIASVVVFGFFYLLVTEFWQPIRRLTGWFLLPLGESALYAYAAHVVVAVPVVLVLDTADIPERWSRPVNLIVQIGTLALIWILVRRRIFFVSPARGRARFLLPVAAAVACLVLLPLDPSPAAPGLATASQIDPYAARVARAFGTPVPGRPLRGEGTPVPLPRLNVRRPIPAIDERGVPVISPYVGSIRGTLRNIQFFSPALDRDMPYFIYLPPGYEEEGRRYPVLYMLHGNSGSYEEWLAYGLIDRADRMVRRQAILPLIIVVPQGDFSYWTNLPDGPRYGDYLTTDLPRHIGATYRVLPGAQHAAVGGLSMGATGALMNAFRNPDIFGVVGAHSPSLPPEGARDFLGAGIDYARRDPISLARRRSGLDQLAIWIDMGDQDDWLERADLLHDTLEERNIDHEWRVAPGDHDGSYWTQHLSDYLRFYDGALNPDRRV